jgi:hypothetical protein
MDAVLFIMQFIRDEVELIFSICKPGACLIASRLQFVDCRVFILLCLYEQKRAVQANVMLVVDR